MNDLKRVTLSMAVIMILEGCSGGGGTPSNHPPEAKTQTITLNENQNKEVRFEAEDVDGNSLTYRVISEPAHGLFVDGVYTPTPNYVGSDSFTFIANDGTVDSEVATVTITITADFDGDDISDQLDTDDDNDGVADSEDAFPLNASESIDTDGDGTGNNADSDDDGDGVVDTDDTFPLDSTENIDTDGDGIGNNADSDDDGDGVVDTDDTFPLDSTERIDTDGDGIGNNADSDDDNDGVSDSDERIAGTDPLDATSTPEIDTDNDGVINSIDTDDDNDGVLDTEDAFPFDPSESIDTDGDGIGNNADSDDDGDGVSDEDEVSDGTDPLDATSRLVTVSGKVTYDLVPANTNGIGLNYGNVTQESVKNVKIDLLDENNALIKSTITDAEGDYAFSVLSNKKVKIRIYAQMIKSGQPSWDVKVVDNTNGDAQYVMEGSLSTTGTSNSIRNLNAASGWDTDDYTSTRTAAPFAILDSVNAAMEKVLTADASTQFEPLLINWSVNNVASGGNLSDGQIGTSFYSDGRLYILGDKNGDTDEYDDHVIAHEWGHYYEDKFSRSDSIGGSHGTEDKLDIRVAFGEGWGNAFSAMALDNPIYFDTMSVEQASGFTMDVENKSGINSGWYSEASIQRILYDLYDDNSDGEDLLSLGFTPLHHVFVGAQKNTEAFTSLFSFITALKSENTNEGENIDKIVASEDIATISDIYGTGRTNSTSSYPYMAYGSLGSTLAITTSNSDGGSTMMGFNKLSNHRYIKFSIPAEGSYGISVQQSNGSDADPDFFIYSSGSPLEYVGKSEETSVNGLERNTLTLPEGDYLLDVLNWSDMSSVAEFNLKIESI